MIAKLSKNRYLTAEERLRAGVDVRGADECWPWLGKKNKRGHGALHANGKLSEGAHRLAWEIGNARRVPEGLWVLHRWGCADKPIVHAPDDEMRPACGSIEPGESVAWREDNVTCPVCRPELMS